MVLRVIDFVDGARTTQRVPHFEPDGVQLNMRDSGIGLDQEAAMSNRGLGLSYKSD